MYKVKLSFSHTYSQLIRPHLFAILQGADPLLSDRRRITAAMSILQLPEEVLHRLPEEVLHPLWAALPDDGGNATKSAWRLC